MSGKHFIEENQNQDLVNETMETQVSETEQKTLGELHDEELRNKLINLEVENQSLKDEINQLKEANNNKDQIINAQQSQINLYVNKYNKDEITIDALQDKLLAVLSTYNNINNN